MSELLKRPWFRFSYRLRSLFGVLVLVGLWVSWQVNWIHQRRTLLTRDSVRYTDPNDGIAAGMPPVVAPWSLGLFGERGYPVIFLHVIGGDRAKRIDWHSPNWENAEKWLEPTERSELERVRRLFPESDVAVQYKLNDD